jgi:hypothetical protein
MLVGSRDLIERARREGPVYADSNASNAKELVGVSRQGEQCLTGGCVPHFRVLIIADGS